MMGREAGWWVQNARAIMYHFETGKEFTKKDVMFEANCDAVDAQSAIKTLERNRIIENTGKKKRPEVFGSGKPQNIWVRTKEREPKFAWPEKVEKYVEEGLIKERSQVIKKGVTEAMIGRELVLRCEELSKLLDLAQEDVKRLEKERISFISELSHLKDELGYKEIEIEELKKQLGGGDVPEEKIRNIMSKHQERRRFMETTGSGFPKIRGGNWGREEETFEERRTTMGNVFEKENHTIRVFRSVDDMVKEFSVIRNRGFMGQVMTPERLAEIIQVPKAFVKLEEDWTYFGLCFLGNGAVFVGTNMAREEDEKLGLRSTTVDSQEGEVYCIEPFNEKQKEAFRALKEVRRRFDCQKQSHSIVSNKHRAESLQDLRQDSRHRVFAEVRSDFADTEARGRNLFQEEELRALDTWCTWFEDDLLVEINKEIERKKRISERETDDE